MEWNTKCTLPKGGTSRRPLFSLLLLAVFHCYFWLYFSAIDGHTWLALSNHPVSFKSKLGAEYAQYKNTLGVFARGEVWEQSKSMPGAACFEYHLECADWCSCSTIIFGGSRGVAARPCSMLACVSQRKPLPPPPPKSFGASTTLWWTNAALASSRAVLKNSPACMPTPGWHARLIGLDYSENYVSQSDSC